MTDEFRRRLAEMREMAREGHCSGPAGECDCFACRLSESLLALLPVVDLVADYCCCECACGEVRHTAVFKSTLAECKRTLTEVKR